MSLIKVRPITAEIDSILVEMSELKSIISSVSPKLLDFRARKNKRLSDLQLRLNVLQKTKNRP